jgi:hemerythrin-like metal-binding protein
MPFLTWSNEFEFGISEIDSQHHHWLDILNNFYDHLEGNNVKEHLLTLIDEAIDYTHYHFSEEEKLMNRIGYPAVDEQKAMHREIAEKILQFKKTIDADKPLVSMTVTHEFKDWFKHHILLEDKKYAQLYLEKEKLGSHSA